MTVAMATVTFVTVARNTGTLLRLLLWIWGNKYNVAMATGTFRRSNQQTS